MGIYGFIITIFCLSPFVYAVFKMVNWGFSTK